MAEKKKISEGERTRRGGRAISEGVNGGLIQKGRPVAVSWEKSLLVVQRQHRAGNRRPRLWEFRASSCRGGRSESEAVGDVSKNNNKDKVRIRAIEPKVGEGTITCCTLAQCSVITRCAVSDAAAVQCMRLPARRLQPLREATECPAASSEPCQWAGSLGTWKSVSGLDRTPAARPMKASRSIPGFLS